MLLGLMLPSKEDLIHKDDSYTVMLAFLTLNYLAAQTALKAESCDLCALAARELCFV